MKKYSQDVPHQPAASAAEPPALSTVKTFAARHPGVVTELALRAQIFDAEPRLSPDGQKVPGNGLQEYGAIIRIGRKILIDESAYFRWVQSHRAGAGLLQPRGGK